VAQEVKTREGSKRRVAGDTIMVTGGCGFIGSHLVRRLASLGAKRVVVVDSLRYGDRANLGRSSSAVEIVRHALGTDSPSILEEKMRGVNHLFHLAAEKHNQSKDDPLAVLRANIEGSYTLFDIAVRSGVEKIVFSSSLYAYGRLTGPPYVEDEPARPSTVYGVSKLAGEQLLSHVHAEHGVAYNVLRYMFVYGPRQYAGMGYKSVIVKNFERLTDGKPPVIYGDGEQALDYIFVDDVVDATICALETDVSGEVLNIGSGEATTVSQLTEVMGAVSGGSVAPLFEPPDWTAGSRRVADVGKARGLLGFTPQTSLRDGLQRTFNWMKERKRHSR
jgi:UDP-glucose 4-epimerase